MDLVCGEPGIEGREGGRLVAHHLVELPQDDDYVVRFDASVDFFVRLEFRSCARDGMASEFYQVRHVYGYGIPEQVVFTDLPAGVYVVRLILEEPTGSLALDMKVEPWAGW